MRFVASTLLDAVRKAETAPVSAARAHGYLCKPHILCFTYVPLMNLPGDFLSILSEIERNYLSVAPTAFVCPLFHAHQSCVLFG